MKDKKDKTLIFRLTEEQEAEVLRLQKLLGLKSVSDVLRLLIIINKRIK